MRINIPATTANIGPGFDSCGLALDLYLSIEVVEDSSEWMVEHSFGDDIPADQENLLIQTALKVCATLTPKRIKMFSDIPLARGLGSSSSVIAGGIELANQLGNLKLTQEEKVQIGTTIEGHPDNIAPAICGGFVVSSLIDEKVCYVKSAFPSCDLIAYVPKKKLLTSESRGLLPVTLDYREAVQASSIANVMIAAILSGDLNLAGKMMEKDRWHEKYRKKLVPHLIQIRILGHQLGAFGTFLSGAGPTVLTACPKEKTEALLQQLVKLPYEAEAFVVSVAQEGIQIL